MRVREAIELLGGPKPVAEALGGITAKAVQQWVTLDCVSGPKAMAFFDLCKKYKLDIKLTDIVRKK